METTEPIQWYAVLRTPEPLYTSLSWPDGIWHSGGRKKYTSLRRAMQALMALQAATPSWGYRVVLCDPPTRQQERENPAFYKDAPVLFSTHLNTR